MRQIFIILILSLIFISSSFTQTVDEILAEYFTVMGQEKLLATTTNIANGKIIQGQFEIPFISYQKRPMNFRMDAEFQGMKIVQAFNGEKGWSINPMMGSTDPVPMTEEQADRFKIQADYDGIYYNYAEKGYTVEFTGTEPIDDINTYVLKLTRPNGDIITSYIDSENFVILKTKSKIKVQGVDTESEAIYSNYKYVDEILAPFSVETKMNGETVMQMLLDSVTFNADIPDSLFQMPEVTPQADSTEVK